MGLGWLAGLVVALASMPDMASMQRDLSKLGGIPDPYSYWITNENSHEVKNGTLWLLNFCHPKALHCQLLNVPWKTMAQDIQNTQEKVIMARVEPDDGLNVFRSFGVADVPTVLVVCDGYVYNYTGKLEPKQLREVIANETYLMYDRRKLEASYTDVRYWIRRLSWAVAQAYSAYPSCFQGSAAILLAGGVIVWGVGKLRGGNKTKQD